QSKDPRLPAILQKLLKDPPLRTSALRGLAAYDDPATPGLILQSYPTFLAADKHEALNTLSSRVSFAKELLAAMDKNRIPRNDLTYLLQNIIDPNAVIPNDYRTSTLETKDDRVITGIVTKQDDNTVAIVVPGETIVVSRKDVKSLVQGELSMMPEGLLAALSEVEVRDLISYLGSQTQVPMFATPDNSSSLFDGKNLAEWEGNLDHWKVEN